MLRRVKQLNASGIGSSQVSPRGVALQPVAAGAPREIPQRATTRPPAREEAAMLSMMSRGAAPPAPLTRPPLPQQRPHRQSGGATATLPLVNPLAAAPVGRQDRRAEVDETAAGTDEAVTATALFEDPDPEETGSWDLVRAAQAGDMTAFGELFDRYYDIVFRYVLFRMGDRSLAEDVTQETFVRALRRISSVSYQGRDIGAWFVTIARNLIFDHVKSSRYRLEHSTGEIIDLSPSTHGPEQQVLEGATSEELLSCVRKLNADQQECIQLRFLQGMSVAETAQAMDRNEGAVKALQHRAIRRLAQLLPEGLR
jgi:RNA polymerase sigma-70 factor, ECF subfamily